MASVFTTLDSLKSKASFGKTLNAPIYLQFVPGVCVDTITSKSTLNSYNEERNINSILALPHIRSKGTKKKKTNLTNGDRYFPLMRGFVDVPAKGDPVLLCTIAGVQYYLGPLNTENNPNFNNDTLFSPEISITSNNQNNVQGGAATGKGNQALINGQSINFIKTSYRRMAKIWNPKLDSSKAYQETHGDMMLEGRHGNSIRIGSRSDNPYIFISNGRQQNFNYEGLADGSLISITKHGTLNQHFGGYGKHREVVTGEEDDMDIINGFTLASDFVSYDEDSPNRLMSKLISSVNNDVDTNQFIYQYGKEKDQNQILFYSDRITINTKTDDIYLSSNKDIHIGTKRHLTISTAENLIVESEKTYLGDPNKKTMDNMVLGKKLQDVLKGIVDVFGKIQVMTQLGPQKIMPTIQPDINNIKSNIEDILSNKHFLEE